MSRSSVGIKGGSGAGKDIPGRENLMAKGWESLENSDKLKVAEAAGMRPEAEAEGRKSRGQSVRIGWGLGLFSQLLRTVACKLESAMEA